MRRLHADHEVGRRARAPLRHIRDGVELGACGEDTFHAPDDGDRVGAHSARQLARAAAQDDGAIGLAGIFEGGAEADPIDRIATSTPTTPAIPTTITDDAPSLDGTLRRFISVISTICANTSTLPQRVDDQ
jgi:hypothetical protein